MNVYVTDMDGTFIDMDKRIPKNVEAFRKLHNEGHKIIFASGRHISLMINEFKELLEIGDFFASENGTSVYKNNYDGTIELLYHNEFTYDESMKIYNIFKDDEKVFVLTKETVGELFFSKALPKFIVDQLTMFKISVLDYPTYVKENAKAKILLMGLPHDLEEAQKKIPSEFESCFTGPVSIEIIKNGINKGYAVKYILDHFDLKYDKLFVFGDSGNDIPMLNLADVSVSMLESREEVKRASKYVATVKCSEGAVAKFLSDYQD